MAGKKTGGTAKSDGKKTSLPKSIGGIKLPKGIREKLTDLATHPVVADLLAAGLVAIAARLKNEPKVEKAAAKAGDAADQVVEAVANAAAAVVKPTAKRARKPVAAKADAAAPRRTRKPASEAASETAAKPPARRTRKTADSGAAKPRATRRAAPKKPSPPEKSE